MPVDAFTSKFLRKFCTTQTSS